MHSLLDQWKRHIFGGEIQIALQATGVLADLGNGESGGGRKQANKNGGTRVSMEVSN